MLRIDKDKISGYDAIEFPGKIIVISTDEDLKELEVLKTQALIGIDTESKPVFRRGKVQKLDLIQLASNDTCFLIQVQYLGKKQLLAQILANPGIEKIGVSLDDDRKKIQEYIGCELINFKDLARIAKEKGIIQTGARNLTARYLKKRLSKSQQTSNWSLRDLSKKQMIYAATDAWICLEIYPKLLSDNTDYRKLKEIEDLQETRNQAGND